MTRRTAALVSLVLAGVLLGVVTSALWASAPAGARAASPVTVGDLTLRPCPAGRVAVARALCGSVLAQWEPGNPSAGRIRVGFAFVPASDYARRALGTLVPHEGGPGYSTTGTGASYAEMYGALLERRNLLLIDQRGTGLSQPVRCGALQDLRGSYAEAAAECGVSLGARSDDYASALGADDQAAVIRALQLGPVDLYGDSYGTFFTQVFAGRHPALVRSIVLDSAYPTYGESGWYPTQGPAIRRAFSAVCARSLTCRQAGRPFLPSLRRVLGIVRVTPVARGLPRR